MIKVALFLSISALTAFADSADFRTRLLPIEAGAPATGTASGKFSTTRSYFSVSASKLTPATTYTLLIDGIPSGTALTSTRGSLLFRFRSPEKKNYLPLNFDPRGKTVELALTDFPVLRGSVLRNEAGPSASGFERSDLDNLLPGSRAKARAHFTLSKSGAKRFTISISKALAGELTVFVNGQALETPLIIARNGSGSVRLADPLIGRDVNLLTLDPSGAKIDLARAGVIEFTGEMRGKARGLNYDLPRDLYVSIPAVSESAIGIAKARFTVDKRARQKFSIEIEGAPIGTYPLSINGTPVGQIIVVNTEDGTEGEIEFKTNDDDTDTLPLTFDPVSSQLSISFGDTVWFSGVFDPSSILTRPKAEAESRLEESLTNTGAEQLATARARYEVDSKGRHRFKIELLNATPGTYTLNVAGQSRGIIQVVALTTTPTPPSSRKGGDDDDDDNDDNDDDGDDDDNNATSKGEVEYRSVVEPRKRLLNFDPRGQLIEVISSSGTTLFSHLLGSGSATGTDPATGSAQPVFTQIALFAAPSVSGSILATFEVDRRNRSKLKLKARNLLIGNYDVLVGGVIRGTLNVLPDDGQTEGEIEFESLVDDAESILLDFPVIDQEIRIEQAGTVKFARVVPAS